MAWPPPDVQTYTRMLSILSRAAASDPPDELRRGPAARFIAGRKERQWTLKTPPIRSTGEPDVSVALSKIDDSRAHKMMIWV